MKKKCLFSVCVCALLSLYFSCNFAPAVPKSSFQRLSFYHNENIFQPWDICWGPDSMLWVTENRNHISRINPQTHEIKAVKIAYPDLSPEKHYGLFMHGLAFHPRFHENPSVYFSYFHTAEEDSGTGKLTVVMMEYNADSNNLTQPKEIIKDLFVSKTLIPGGRLFTDESHLFVCTSDIRKNGNSQNIDSLHGKILRYNLDGSIPADNPFKNNPTWTLGHRNPQGLFKRNGFLYSIEHGPNDGDEINKLEPGKNYGWPLISGLRDEEEMKISRSIANYRDPAYQWTPTIAPASMAYCKFYSNELIIVPTLKESDVRILKFEGDKIIPLFLTLNNKYGRLRDVCVANNKLYISTFNQTQKTYYMTHIPPKDEQYTYDLVIEISY